MSLVAWSADSGKAVKQCQTDPTAGGVVRKSGRHRPWYETPETCPSQLALRALLYLNDQNREYRRLNP